MRHVQGLDLRTLLVVDAENVRRSAWPNVSKEDLVARARAWAEREQADLLIVFDGRSARGRRRTSSAPGRRSADDVIAELEARSGSRRPTAACANGSAPGPRGSRRRLVPSRARGGAKLTPLTELAVEIEGVELGRNEIAVSPEFRRVTTIVHLRGGGKEGLGEDVTYLADLHDDVPVPDVAGSWTLGSFSESLEGFRWFSELPEDNAAFDYRRWAWESAALDLAL